MPPRRTLHPYRVQIVQLLRRAGRPLSADHIVDRLGGRSSAFLTACHLRRLRHLGIIVPAGQAKSGRHALDQLYRLNKKPEA